MKNTLAIAAVAITASAPAFADVSAQQFFALNNDSAAERIIHQTSIGNVEAAQITFAQQNESAAEENLILGADTATRGDVQAAQRFFSLSEDSAAEIN